ncbi:MAG TPA: response regulator transcription factor [Gaiellaceae bacterium]|jgi:two-component system nitrate/nitrite response regulator NarL|nr:response regulator transcription factor [Gaiellaceae bacterium]
MAIRVLIADDHRLFAEALEAILASDTRIQVVAHAGDGEEAVKLARELKPDVVLMDISMPVMDGIEAAGELKRNGDDVTILMLTGSNSRDDVDRARKAGAAGYVTKDRIAAELIDAIIEIAQRS